MKNWCASRMAHSYCNKAGKVDVRTEDNAMACECLRWDSANCEYHLSHFLDKVPYEKPAILLTEKNTFPNDNEK